MLRRRRSRAQQGQRDLGRLHASGRIPAARQSMNVSRSLIRSRPTRALWCDCIMAWCACIMPLAGGCVHFQTSVSDPLPAEERVVVGDRGQLRVIDKNPSGAHETVLLVHGYGSSTASYAPVMDALAAHLRVLAVDLPGFGKSDRRDGDYTPDALADVLAEVLTQKGRAARARRRPLLGLVGGAGVRATPSRACRSPGH